MTQTRSGALDALETLVKAAMDAAGIEFHRNPEKSVAATREGVAIMTDGDPGEPEVILSPLAYVWEHAVEFEIAACGPGRKTAVENVIALFDPALAADRTLGGAVDDARIVTAPEFSEYEEEGIESERSAVLEVTLYYTTASGAN